MHQNQSNPRLSIFIENGSICVRLWLCARQVLEDAALLAGAKCARQVLEDAALLAGALRARQVRSSSFQWMYLLMLQLYLIT